MKTIGIIGAGACGLCSIKHSIANGLSPIAWEHGSSLGGTWNYSESVGNDEYGYPICSSMYQNLKTDLPKEIMGFPDFPFPEEKDSFIHHTSVLRYLNLYTENYSLMPYINFNHHVNLVEPIFEGESQPSWKVTVKNLKTGEICNKICDFLMVGNGHCSIPKKCDIKGIENFSGIQLHSHYYRKPVGFSGKTVAVLGAGPSGVDIALELADVAVKVYLCHNHPIPIPSKFPVNMYQRRGIIEAQGNGFILTDKSYIEADVIIYCTGYEYDFPFLSAECKIRIENNTVRPLYKHVLHADFPTMGFPGLFYQVLPFPMFDVQVRFLISVFSGEITPPSRSQMNLETDREIKRFTFEGNNPNKFLHFFTRQENYMNSLLDAIHQQRLPPLYIKLLHTVILRIVFDGLMFKKYTYSVCSNGMFREMLKGEPITTSWDLPATIFLRLANLSVTNFGDVFCLIFSKVWIKVKISILDSLSWFGLWDNYI